ncbi:hypothetical protein CDQ83_10040 [Clostridium thermosuccinogenes]|nr:hypothetical protein CDO33_14535 [Pseudoclostridium thermosuccinogenes]PNT93805.1 hypothetical protein CDQ83_10040 [Pseudoclostridium thermosuccinogenes]
MQHFLFLLTYGKWKVKFDYLQHCCPLEASGIPYSKFSRKSMTLATGMKAYPDIKFNLYEKIQLCYNIFQLWSTNIVQI